MAPIRKLPPIPDMESELRHLLQQIPAGHVTTYGTLAESLGNKIASRWVGTYLLHHEHDASCACHRVVRATGELGGYVSGDPDGKVRLLASEGVSVRDGRVNLDDRFVEFRCGDMKPLEMLKQFQAELLGDLRIEDFSGAIETVAGLDVSYAKNGDAVGAYTLHDAANADLTWSTTARMPQKFPYISTYLAFRELPVLLRLIEIAAKQNKMADVIVVDGSGIMHPRQSGIATMLGILGSIPTIGLTKKQLFGRYDQASLNSSSPTWVYVPAEDEERIGATILPPSGSKKPIYISPGNLIDVETATATVMSLWNKKRRLPEPIYWADRLSRAEAS